MHVPCSLGYFECQHVAPNCCCHIRKASITTCLLVTHWQSKLQVSFCTCSTTVPETQSVQADLGLGWKLCPWCRYKLQGRDLKVVASTQNWPIKALDNMVVVDWLFTIPSPITLSPLIKPRDSLGRFLMYWILWSCNVVFCYYGLKLKFITGFLVKLGHIIIGYWWGWKVERRHCVE